jgi:hypothetical protein
MDRKSIAKRATELGISKEDVPAFASQCVDDAIQLLRTDGGVAWDRVTVALKKKKRLSGDEVRGIVKKAESDISAAL